MAIEEALKKVLGSVYGGPSISYENDKFVLYEWGDAPVGMYILISASTFEELLEKIVDFAENKS